MVNTVVFDIGNVLVDFRWQGLFEDLGFTGEKFEAIAKLQSEVSGGTNLTKAAWN